MSEIVRGVGLRLKLWIGRPSGHSIYYTLIGTFSSQEEAASAFEKCVRKYGRNHVHYRKDRNEVQLLPSDEVWDAEELSPEINKLTNLGAYDVETVENFWDFEVAFSFDVASATQLDIELLMQLKFPELGKYLEYLDKWIEHTNDCRTRYHLAYRGSGNDVPEDLSLLFSHESSGEHEFLEKKIGTSEIPECELVTCC